MKSLWIQNLIAAPKERETEEMRDGLAPLLTIDEVKDPNPHPIPNVEELFLVWTEEGDGVALFEKEELIAFLPPWSGIQNIHGYNRNAKENAITASPLGDGKHGVLVDRVTQSQKFWESASDTNRFSKWQKKELEFLEAKLGPHDKYWSADGGKYPKLAIVSFLPPSIPGTKIFVTIGMSMQNQPSIELYHKDFENHARIELALGIQLPKDSQDQSETWVQHVLGEMIKFPWNTGIWFGHAHTIQNPRKDPLQLYQNFSWMIFYEESSNALSRKEYSLEGLESDNGRPVRFLHLLPIGEEEKLYITSESSQKFFEVWNRSGFPMTHDSERKPLEF